MVVLFDMDGTLTPAREEIDWDVVAAVRKLTGLCRVGIISGSDMDYISQQCERLFSLSGPDPAQLDILPCNGTKLYQWKYTKYEIVHEANMVEEIGEEHYRSLIQFCSTSQSAIIAEHSDIPFSGTFIQYRGSLLNWCPVGRSADSGQRKAFINSDEKAGLRSRYADAMREIIKERKIPVTVALGGSTSLDIYPDGWDKTYGLKHYKDQDVYFIGDRCEEGGNDWHIYEALKSADRAWQTTGPTATIKIINEIIKRIESV